MNSNKKSTTVYWTLALDHLYNKPSAENIIYIEPTPVYKEILSERDKSNEFLKCPAFRDMCKNTYAIKAPLDITIDIENADSFKTNVTKEFFDKWCLWRSNFGNTKNPFIITLPPAFIFYTKSNVVIESIPAFLQNNESLQNVNLIPGRFNISKWVRPVDFTFEVLDPTRSIKIKRGDTIFYVRFITDDDSDVELERTLDDAIYPVSLACVGVKHQIRNIPLNKLYDMAKGYINSFWKTK